MSDKRSAGVPPPGRQAAELAQPLATDRVHAALAGGCSRGGQLLSALGVCVRRSSPHQHLLRLQGMQPELGMLTALALVEKSGEEELVAHFPASALSRQPATRFAQLFAARARWQAADLELYLADVQGPGQSVQQLLLKYCRANQASAGAPIEYSAR